MLKINYAATKTISNCMRKL